MKTGKLIVTLFIDYSYDESRTSYEDAQEHAKHLVIRPSTSIVESVKIDKIETI